MEELNKTEVQLEGLSLKEAIELKDFYQSLQNRIPKKEDDISDKDWLAGEFKKELPEISDEEAEKMASETVESISEYNENLSSINDSAKKGINKEQWFVNKVAEASTGMSVIEQGQYLQSIDNAITNANTEMMKVVTRQDGGISQNWYLDGYIAEQYHVNTFNANAALKKSNYYAEVMTPEPGATYPKNSFDIVIRDRLNPKATPVHQYQVKYGVDAEHTINLLKDYGEVTKYSNQQIVVPPDQVEAVKKAFPGKTVVSTIGGTDKVDISSNPLTKEQAKELQLSTQEKGITPKTDWNAFTNKDLALHIGKNAGMVGIQAAAITTGFSLAAQAIKGDGIDVEESVELALKTGTDAGVKAATTGAVKVGVEKGVIGVIPKGTPVGALANIVCVSIENIKILGKVATGEYTISQGLDHMGRNTVAMTYGLGWGAKGAVIGASALAWIPVVGPFIGGVVGGTIGYIAGSKFGSAVYSGIRAIGKGVSNACKSAWNGIKSAGSKIKSWLFG